MDISIIMVGSNFYNDLDQSMESIANQEGYRNFKYEVILLNVNTVDRGQTDSKIRDWKRKATVYEPFDFLAFKVAGGIPTEDIIKLGVSKARADIIVYLLPQDTMAKNRLVTVFNLFTNIYNEGCHGIYSAFDSVFAPGMIIEPKTAKTAPLLARAHRKGFEYDDPSIEWHYSPVVAGIYGDE